VAAGERALSLDPNATAPYSTLARALNHAGQTARALKVDELAIARGVAGGDTRGQMIAEEFVLGETQRSRNLVIEARGTPLERDALLQLFDIDMATGQVREAEAAAARADAIGRPEGITLDYTDYADALGAVGLTAQARRELSKTPTEERDGYYYATAARTEPISTLANGLQRLLAEEPHDTLLHDLYAPLARARLLERQGKADAAVRALHLAPPAGLHDMNGYYEKGLAQLASGDPAGAAASFRRVLAETGFAYDTPYFNAHLGLARALARTGDIRGAEREYEAFLSSWRSADPDLPPLRQAKAELARLQAGRGN
jgi:eukaryotic-like serine/threonine-protein kinase